MKKIMLVFGTRPEAIKMAPLVLALRRSSSLSPIIVTTGQHKEMLEQVMDIFNISSDYDMSIMSPGQTLTDITTKILNGMKEAIQIYKPDMILVHGDTTTSVAAALSAFYHQIPIGHVEAGLRTNIKYSPFPEEINRQLTSKLADLHFSPTHSSKINLKNEGIEKNVFVTGNTGIDSIFYTTELEYTSDLLDEIEEKGHRMLFMTIHRRENLEINMENIFRAILEIVNYRLDVEVVFPVHLNPIVQELATSILGNHKRIHLIKPLDVVGCHHFIKQSYLILTDSGGIQEEAPSLGVPVLIARETTERPEGIESGNLKLVGVNHETIVREVLNLLDDSHEYNRMSIARNPYGDGRSAFKIVKIIDNYFD